MQESHLKMYIRTLVLIQYGVTVGTTVINSPCPEGIT